MQSLALDVNVVSEEGARAEMREEDDDLLRAAEELGIDLSGVRADRRPGRADEATEGGRPRPTADAEADDAGATSTPTATRTVTRATRPRARRPSA